MTIEALTTLSRSIEALATERTKPAAAPAAGGAAGADFERALDAAAMRPVEAKGHQSGKPDDLEQFEGFVLRTFVEAMLPKEGTSFFSSGTAGGIWRSMMAERLGEELAAGGGIGIADLLRDQANASASAGREDLRAEADRALAQSARTLPRP